MERRVSDAQENLRLELRAFYYCCFHDINVHIFIRLYPALCSEVEQKLEKCTAELQECQEVLKVKEEELQTSKQEMQDSQKVLEEKEREMEQHVQDLQESQSALKELEERMKQGDRDLEESWSLVRQQEQELARVKEVLRRTEEELDQRVALMGERCSLLEDERGEKLKIVKIYILGLLYSLIVSYCRS